MEENLSFIDLHYKRILDKEVVSFETIERVLTIWNSTFPISSSATELQEKCLRFLQRVCCQGTEYREYLLSETEDTLNNIKLLLSSADDKVARLSWQLLSNLVVQSPTNARKIQSTLLDTVVEALKTPHPNLNPNAAVIYNIMEANDQLELDLDLPLLQIYSSVLKLAFDKEVEMEKHQFIQFILERMLLKTTPVQLIYSELESNLRINLHHFIIEYVKSGSEGGHIHSALLKCLSSNYSELSNRILVWIKGVDVKVEDPAELLSLLECLAHLTGSSDYSIDYRSDASMFINSSALLVACCESQKTELVSKSKLSDLTNMMNEEQSSPMDPFFDFKTYLIRIIANLAYKNKKNQDYARDLNVLLTICGCTALDARNPLMKEWSIVAIRNLLEKNLENQKMVHQLTSQGRVQNDLLKEFQMATDGGDGVMRIGMS